MFYSFHIELYAFIASERTITSILKLVLILVMRFSTPSRAFDNSACRTDLGLFFLRFLDGGWERGQGEQEEDKGSGK